MKQLSTAIARRDQQTEQSQLSGCGWRKYLLSIAGHLYHSSSNNWRVNRATLTIRRLPIFLVGI